MQQNNMGILMQAMKNPLAFLQQAMQSRNPIMQNAIQMYQRGDKQGLNELANNLCKEKNINRQDFEKQIMSRFGM